MAKILKSLSYLILKESAFLAFRPSQNAAACILAAINISASDELCFDMGFDRIQP